MAIPMMAIHSEASGRPTRCQQLDRVGRHERRMFAAENDKDCFASSFSVFFIEEILTSDSISGRRTAEFGRATGTRFIIILVFYGTKMLSSIYSWPVSALVMTRSKSLQEFNFLWCAIFCLRSRIDMEDPSNSTLSNSTALLNLKWTTISPPNKFRVQIDNKKKKNLWTRIPYPINLTTLMAAYVVQSCCQIYFSKTNVLPPARSLHFYLPSSMFLCFSF